MSHFLLSGGSLCVQLGPCASYSHDVMQIVLAGMNIYHLQEYLYFSHERIFSGEVLTLNKLCLVLTLIFFLCRITATENAEYYPISYNS